MCIMGFWHPGPIYAVHPQIILGDSTPNLSWLVLSWLSEELHVFFVIDVRTVYLCNDL